MAKPKITVIIPTRERCDVLEKSLQTVTSQDYENLDIIVSDNFSSDGTEDLVRSIDDKRVRYLNTGQRISMSHNWEFALSHVSDGWVTMIGDNDGLPFPIRCTRSGTDRSGSRHQGYQVERLLLRMARIDGPCSATQNASVVRVTNYATPGFGCPRCSRAAPVTRNCPCSTTAAT